MTDKKHSIVARKKMEKNVTKGGKCNIGEEISLNKPDCDGEDKREKEKKTGGKSMKLKSIVPEPQRRGGGSSERQSSRHH